MNWYARLPGDERGPAIAGRVALVQRIKLGMVEEDQNVVGINAPVVLADPFNECGFRQT